MRLLNWLRLRSKAKPNAACAAIEFALKLEDKWDAMEFLELWLYGQFDAIRDNWPEAPDEIFIGADASFKPRR